MAKMAHQLIAVLPVFTRIQWCIKKY